MNWLSGAEKTESADRLVVVSMGADPKPVDDFRHVMPQGTIMLADPDRPDLVNALEAQRRVSGVALQQGKILVRDRTDILRQRVVQRPEARRRGMLQMLRDLPDL